MNLTQINTRPYLTRAETNADGTGQGRLYIVSHVKNGVAYLNGRRVDVVRHRALNTKRPNIRFGCDRIPGQEGENEIGSVWETAGIAVRAEMEHNSFEKSFW